MQYINCYICTCLALFFILAFIRLPEYHTLQFHTFLFLLSSRRGQVTLFGIVMFKLTLHEAIASVLESHNRPLSANELADEINSRRLYVRKDGALLRSGQIHARVNKYPHLFIKDENGGITLK